MSIFLQLVPFCHRLLYFHFLLSVIFFFLHSSNHGFLLLRFAVFCFSILRFLPFCFFAFVIMRLPKTNSLQVGCKLADKTKHKIMTEVLRVFAGLDVKAVSSVSPSPLRSSFGRPNRFQESIFSVCGAVSWAAAPL